MSTPVQKMRELNVIKDLIYDKLDMDYENLKSFKEALLSYVRQEISLQELTAIVDRLHKQAHANLLIATGWREFGLLQDKILADFDSLYTAFEATLFGPNGVNVILNGVKQAVEDIRKTRTEARAEWSRLLDSYLEQIEPEDIPELTRLTLELYAEL